MITIKQKQKALLVVMKSLREKGIHIDYASSFFYQRSGRAGEDEGIKKTASAPTLTV